MFWEHLLFSQRAFPSSPVSVLEVPALHHEPFDDSVKLAADVGQLRAALLAHALFPRAQREEILNRQRGFGVEQIKLYATLRSAAQEVGGVGFRVGQYR